MAQECHGKPHLVEAENKRGLDLSVEQLVESGGGLYVSLPQKPPGRAVGSREGLAVRSVAVKGTKLFLDKIIGVTFYIYPLFPGKR